MAISAYIETYLNKNCRHTRRTHFSSSKRLYVERGKFQVWWVRRVHSSGPELASRQDPFFLFLITLLVLLVLIYILVSIDEAKQHRSIQNDKLHHHLESSILRVQLCHVTDSCHQLSSNFNYLSVYFLTTSFARNFHSYVHKELSCTPIMRFSKTLCNLNLWFIIGGKISIKCMKNQYLHV